MKCPFTFEIRTLFFPIGKFRPSVNQNRLLDESENSFVKFSVSVRNFLIKKLRKRSSFFTASKLFLQIIEIHTNLAGFLARDTNGIIDSTIHFGW